MHAFTEKEKKRKPVEAVIYSCYWTKQKSQ